MRNNFKKRINFLGRSLAIAILLFFLMNPILKAPQELSHDSKVTYVEVPVRVHKKGVFVDGLSAENFQILEDGLEQKIEAFYLVKNSELVKAEEKKNIEPQTSRNFFLIMQMMDYNNKIEDGIENFFTNTIQPTDSVEVWTPIKKYTLKSEAIQRMSPEELSKQFIKTVRKDITKAGSEYQGLVASLRSVIRGISSLTGGIQSSHQISSMFDDDASLTMPGTGLLLDRYRQSLDQIKNMNQIDMNSLQTFAGQLSRKKGQNIVLFFYERQYKPEFTDQVWIELQNKYSGEMGGLGIIHDLFSAQNQNIEYPKEAFGKIFADTSAMVNLIYLESKPKYIGRSVKMVESSTGVYDLLSTISHYTGGKNQTVSNPTKTFENMIKDAENYYLLYYQPPSEKAESQDQFKSIEVKVDVEGARVSHRKGYLSK